MAAATPTPAEFLRTLWGDIKGFAELTAIQGSDVKSFPFTYPDSLDSLIFASGRHNKTHNVYMGVCLRKEQWPRWTGRMKNGKKEMEFRGTEENALSSFAIWCEFDFEGLGHKGRTVPEETARKWLLEFKLKPSIVVRSGGGIQIFWLLKEAAKGDDLWRVKATNKAIVQHFTIEDQDGKKHGADTQSVDLARIFRIPGSTNLKYTPHRPCTISWWKPEFRYNLPDFEEILKVEDPEKPKPSPITATSTAPQSTATAPASAPQAEGGPRQMPGLIIPEDKITDMVRHFSEIWFEGSRHAMALRVAGMLAFAGVALESALKVVEGASNAVGGLTEKRLKDVSDTYDNFMAGKEVVGGPSLEKLIDEDFPPFSRAKAKKTLEIIRRLLPRPPKPPASDPGYGDDFEITKLVKFDSRPARWSVEVKLSDGRELSATAETTILMTFKTFQAAFFEQTHAMLRFKKEGVWRLMLGGVKTIEVKETPDEARPEGAISKMVSDFLEEAKEAPDIGLLKSFPGYDSDSIFFTYPALRRFMKEEGSRYEDRIVYEHLKHELGFKSNQSRRFGQKVAKVWIRSFNGNGHPKKETTSKGGPEKAPVTQEPSLFKEEAQGEETQDIVT